MKRFLVLAAWLGVPALGWAQTPPETGSQPPPATQPAPAPARPVAAPAPAAEPADYADTRKGFDGRLMLGGSMRTLSSTRTYEGAVFGAFGGQIRHVAIHGELGFEHGRTSFGLPVSRFHLGPSIEGIVDRVRFGGGFDFVYSSFRRATRSGTVGALALDLNAFALVDIVRFDGGAFIGGLRGDLELLLGAQVGGTLLLGARF